MIDSSFVTAKCSLPMKELAEKNSLLAYTVFTCKSCLHMNICEFLGRICFLLIICKTFNLVWVLVDMLFSTSTHCNY